MTMVDFDDRLDEAHKAVLEMIPETLVDEDLSGLAPAFIIIGDLDLFVDESIDYAQRLAAAGVPTELHILPGAVHGSQYFLPTAEVSMRWKAIEADALRIALHGSG